jgi:hypothetical protein
MGANKMVTTSLHQRRRVGGVGMAVGAVLGTPLIALLASPVAGADPDDVTTTVYGPYDGFSDALSVNSATDGFDSYLTGTMWGALDISYDGPGSDSSEVLLTDPGAYQIGFDDVAGKISFIDITNPADFLPTDPGLADIGGL